VARNQEKNRKAMKISFHSETPPATRLFAAIIFPPFFKKSRSLQGYSHNFLGRGG